jgi:hypothetical protein
VPTIAEFSGISVRMYFGDHPRPHVHVFYQGIEARLEINDGSLMSGQLPAKVNRRIRDWIQEKNADLMRNWSYAVNYEPLFRIS